MGVLQRFEKRLENLVEGAFARVFKGVVHPVEIASAMQREADAHKSILGGGRTLVPNRYIIDLSPPDHDRLAQYAAPLAQELAQTQAEFIGEQGWMVYGDVIVEIERGDGLDTGMFRIAAEVYTGGMEEAGGDWQQGYGEQSAPTTGAGDAYAQNQYPAEGYGDQGYGGYGAPPVSGAGPAPAMGADPYGGGAQYDQGYGAPASGAPMGHRQARLIAADGRQFAVAVGSTVIGRGEGSQVRLTDVGISRQHARLEFDGGRVVLTDLGSTNGTTVNGARVNAATLQHGDVVQLGTTTLTFRLDG